MKNIILILTIIFLSACKETGSSTGSTNVAGIKPHKGSTNMVMHQQYVVSKGDQIIKDSDLAKVKVTHTDGNSKSTVELIEGSAILKKN